MQKYHMNNNKENLKDKIKEVLKRDTNILFAYLHGSFTSNSLPFRDIDIALFLNKNVLSNKFIKYEIELTTTLSELINYPVDIVILNHAPLSIQYHVTKGNLIICQNINDHYNLLEKIWREYFDFQPFTREMLQELLE